MKPPSNSKAWQNYEQVATFLLNSLATELGLERVEGKQALPGASGTTWEVDAKGVAEGSEAFLVVECRCYKKARQSQAKMASMAYQIKDTGAKGGIIVSPLGLQVGAKKIAESSNILNVLLDLNSTPDEFAMKFLNKLYLGVSARAEATAEAACDVLRVCATCGARFPAMHNERHCFACSGG